MPKTVDKITAFKALLGDEAARKVVAEAESREKAAQAAGIQFKNADEETHKLSTLLEQIDAMLAEGKVVDDVNETEETTAAPVAKEAAFTMDAFKSAVAEIVDTKIAALKEELAKPVKTEKEVTDEAAVAKQKEIDDLKLKQKELDEKIAELTGEQPRASAYRASRAKDNVTEKENAATGPRPDPLDTFISEMVLGGK